jgi:creatinine amidohydrolase
VYPTRRHWVPLSGVLSSARGSDAAKGQLIAEVVASRLAEAIEARFP